MKRIAFLVFGILMLMTVMTACGKSKEENLIVGTYEINKETLMIYFDNKLDHLANFRLENDKMIWESILDDVVYVRVN